jgi:hypothetical protein
VPTVITRTGLRAIPALVQVFEHGEPRLRYFPALALKEINKTPQILVAIDGELGAHQNCDSKEQRRRP